MLAKAPEKKYEPSTFKPVPNGMHLARCYRIVDCGTQESNFKGEISFKRKVMLQFEVHGEDDDGNPLITDKGEPMSISKNYNLTLHEKSTLFKDLQSWRGRNFTPEELLKFDMKNVLGAWCMVSVIRTTADNGKDYTNISAIMSVPPAIKKAGIPEGKNELKMFDLDNPDMELFETFSNYLQDKIRLSPEWQSLGNKPKPVSKGSFADMEDDIPFN